MTDITKVPLAEVPAGWRIERSGSRAQGYCYAYRHEASKVCVHGYHGADGLFWSWNACNISARDLSSTDSEALAEALDAARAHVQKLASQVTPPVAYDNGCVAEPFAQNGWSGMKLTAPDGSKRHVGVMLSEGDEDGEISAFFYEGETDDIVAAELAVDGYIDVWPDSDKEV